MTFAVRAGGKGDVTDTHLLWDVQRGANVTSPVLVNDYLYWSHDKAIALCLRASDGEEMFRERLPTRSRVYASIVSDGKKLFLTTRDAGVLVLAANPTYQELAINQVGNDDEKFNATPAIAGDRLILRSDQAVYCIKEPSRN
jgi:outer membrane protein assembly factor BamB